MRKFLGLAALFSAGLLLAGVLTATGVADITTTETLSTTTTVQETTTAPAQTVVSTVEQTTTQKIRVPAKTTATTSEASSTSSTPTWVWVVLAILAAAVIGLLVAFFTRGSGGVSGEERQRRLEAAVASWAAQGWAVENQSPGSAILRRGPEVMVVSVDNAGQVSTRPAAGQ